jgi:hypothetical protein
MGEQINVRLSISKMAKNVYEIRAVAKGMFFKRQYIGYSEKDALKLFKEWLGDQL